MQLCKIHRVWYGDKCPQCKGKEKKPAKIPPVSEKRKKVNVDYSKEAKQYCLDNPICKIQMPGICTHFTQGVHHVRGRIGDYLTDKRYWLPSCNSCNLGLEINDQWARDNGFKQSKHLKRDEI